MKYFVALLLMSGAMAMAEMTQLTQENFADTISKSKMPVVVDVSATWCGACQQLHPVFDELSQEYEGKVLFAKVDFDSQKELAGKYKVTALPTLLFFRPGQTTPVMQHTGSLSKKDLKEKVAQLLKKS
jgi:thioredoxin 1